LMADVEALKPRRSWPTEPTIRDKARLGWYGGRVAMGTDNPGVQAALRLMRKPATRLADNVAEALDPGEQVIRMAKGDRAGGAFSGGVLVLTDRRLFFLKHGPVRKSSESIPLDLITSVAVNMSLLTDATIKTQGAQSTEVIERVNKADAKELVGELRRLLNERARVVTAPSPAGGSDFAEQLTRLGQLRADGLLTDAEFEQRKAKLLAEA